MNKGVIPRAEGVIPRAEILGSFSYWVLIFYDAWVGLSLKNLELEWSN